MKIALFTEGYDPFVNGVVTSLRTLRAALEAQGHEVVIFAPSYHGREEREPGVVRLPSVPRTRRIYPALSPLAAHQDVLAGQGFDVLHSQHPFSMGRLAERMAERHGLPLVYTFHTMLTEYGAYVPLLGPLVTRRLTHKFVEHCNAADRVVVATQVIRDFLRDRGVRSPVEVVGIGVPPLRPSPGARPRVRAALSLPEEVPLLLYTGRLAREKRLDFLLHALARLDPRTPFHLSLVGGGPREHELRTLTAHLGLSERVSFPGWVRHEEVADWYAASDLFVFPSPSDAMGIVLVEAMSVGLPCVAVGRYGPREVLVDGVTGLLTDFDEQDFAAGVQRLLADPLRRAQMGEAGKRRARDFAPNVTARQLVTVYQEAAAKGRPAPARKRSRTASRRRRLASRLSLRRRAG